MPSGTPRPFRFSLQVFDAPDRAAWAEMAKRAEDVGCAVLLTADHLDRLLPPLVPLVAAASATTTLRVGSLVVNNDFRHPALLAREAAAVDLLSDGRLELGLGAGHAFHEYARIGMPFDRAGVRVSRLEESVQILRRLLDGATVDFAGEHYRIDGESCHPRPVQEHVPLLVGGGGNRVLGIAARHADIVGFTGAGRTRADGLRHETTGFPPAAVDDQVRRVRAAAGDRLDALELQALVQAVVETNSPRAAAEDIVGRRTPSLTADDVLGSPYMLVGPTSALVEKLLAGRERWGISHITFRTDGLDAMTPVIAELAGR